MKSELQYINLLSLPAFVDSPAQIYDQHFNDRRIADASLWLEKSQINRSVDSGTHTW